MAGGRSSAPSCVGLRSIARRSRSCSASQARLFRPAAALSPPQARTKEASYPRFGNIVGGAVAALLGDQGEDLRREAIGLRPLSGLATETFATGLRSGKA